VALQQAAFREAELGKGLAVICAGPGFGGLGIGQLRWVLQDEEEGARATRQPALFRFHSRPGELGALAHGLGAFEDQLGAMDRV
jgi:hypothetical protein